MNACAAYQETLWLDVYGELTSAGRADWEAHLSACPDCRRERERLRRMLRTVQAETPRPRLTASRGEALTQSILEARRAERQKTVWPGWLKQAPALLAGCFVIITLAWFGIQQVNPTPSMTASAGLSQEEKLLIQDYEVIRNLDLLEEMDDLKKLVEVVDSREYGRVPDREPEMRPDMGRLETEKMDIHETIPV